MRSALVGAFCLIPALVAPAAGETAPDPEAGFERLAAEADAALNTWRYEKAAELLDRMAQLAPQDQRVGMLRLRLLVRLGRFAPAGELALELGSGAAAKLSADEGLKAGVALLVAGRRNEARRWILAAARRAGPDGSERFVSALAALASARGAHGAVTARFAAELAAPEAERAEAARAYGDVCAELAALKPPAGAAAHLELARWAAQYRLAELSDEAAPEPPRPLLERLPAAWRAPLGVDETVEHFALLGDALVAAGQPNGRALPGAPLAATVRAFDLASGRERWALPVAPGSDRDADAAAIAAPPEASAYSARIDAMAVDGGRVCLLVKTSRSRQSGATRSLLETAAEILAVDGATGRALWRAPVNRRASQLSAVGPTLVAAGFRTLSAHSSADGKLLWEKEFPHSLSGVSARAGDDLIVPSWREVMRVEAGSGKVRWSVERPPAATSVMDCFVSGDHAAMCEKGADTFGVTCLRSADGERVWARSFAARGQGSSRVAMAACGKTLIAGRDWALRGMELATGRDLWSSALPLPAGASGCALSGAEEHLAWAAGGELALLSPADGRALWWRPSTQPGVQLVGLAAGGQPALLIVSEGAVPRTLAAWRTHAGGEAGPRRAETQAAAALIAGAAARLSAGGKPRAAMSLLDIARTCAAPGAAPIEWELFRQELAAGGVSPAMEERGLLRAALAGSGGDAPAAAAFFASVLAMGQASPEAKSTAAAALLFLGDEAGARHLAANAKLWTASPARLAGVIAACRAAGPAGLPVLLAGARNGEGAARAALIEQLAGHRGDEVRKTLEALLADADADVRLAAALALHAALDKEAIPILIGAYNREQNFLARNEMRRLLLALGHNPAPPDPGPRQPWPRPTPRPTPTPTPAPRPELTREQALERAAAQGPVAWTAEDPQDKTLLWIGVGGKFAMLYSSGEGSLTDYADFLKMVGRKEVSARNLAFGVDGVWAATDRGAFVYDRRTRAWSQLVINLDFELLEADVEKVELDGNALRFTVKDRGTFEQDIKTRQWKKL